MLRGARILKPRALRAALMSVEVASVPVAERGVKDLRGARERMRKAGAKVAGR